MRARNISSVITAYAPEFTPYDYQGAFLDNYDDRLLIYKKPRQVGCSLMAAHKALMRTCAMPNHQVLLLSLNLADAKGKIEYAYRLYDAIAREIGAPAIDNKSRMELSFVNGSKILAVYTPRGKDKADIVLDEFAHFLDPEAIWQATLPIMVHPSSRLTVMSTPLHSHTMFHRIFEGEGGKFQKFKRTKLRWWDCPTHCKDIGKARQQILGPDELRRIETFDSVRLFGTETLKEIFDSMPLDQFETEFELKEMDDDAALLPMELILKCAPTGDAALEEWTSLHEVREKSKGLPLYAGMDIGRIKDAGELTVGIEREPGKIEECHAQTFIDTPFEMQEDYCNDLLKIPNLMRLAVDSTGMGEPIGESLERKWGHRVMRVKFSGPQVSTLATTLKSYMETGRVTFFFDRDSNAQMHSVKRLISTSGHRVSYAAPRAKSGAGRRHHGDRFWSRALKVFAHADVLSLGKPRVRFI